MTGSRDLDFVLVVLVVLVGLWGHWRIVKPPRGGKWRKVGRWDGVCNCGRPAVLVVRAYQCQQQVCRACAHTTAGSLYGFQYLPISSVK